MRSYREVKCPFCNHVFMWNEKGREEPVYYIYRLKETRESVEVAKCPKCSKEMIVLPHLWVGIGFDDDRIETIGVRGL